ncbi:hypothetical protein VCUG_00683 [Vavraia culicis subsp. floridensis]|uniref:Uncharacterized protein n=1 Tax=Vavraia culicis (isolate floridensis) TaxID=948595 RepID=L2GVZ0_VAVCU|nr:uncharacterized protein VCUG_00683 [Vavraia culicis subsp. floridensis]ELA47841.1 hypothetical protein VCUG_00683 [Vavraia culicis subsp. floridensis]
MIIILLKMRYLLSHPMGIYANLLQNECAISALYGMLILQSRVMNICCLSHIRTKYFLYAIFPILYLNYHFVLFSLIVKLIYHLQNFTRVVTGISSLHRNSL